MREVPRIPFLEAISDPYLFKTEFDKLSVPQAVALKIFYGAPLVNKDEMAIWSAMQGEGIYDDLGYLIDIRKEVPYIPKEYSHATVVVGRRASKTHKFSSFVVAFEALCGAHQNYTSQKQDAWFVQIAQDLNVAKSNLRQFIMDWLESSPIGKKQIDGEPTADSIRLKHRALITVAAPNIKVRSQAVAVCAMDELCVWPTDSESANPDYEIERAIRPAMAQFPHRKLLQTSSAGLKEGILYRGHQTGTMGIHLPEMKRKAWSSFLYIQAPTALFRNPMVPRSYLEEERERDFENFRREYLAEFTDSISSFLNAGLLRDAVMTGIAEIPYNPKFTYAAALDPAFRRDAFTFAICHWEPEVGIVQDVVRRWIAKPGEVNDPELIFEEIAPLLRTYNIPTVGSDQYQLEALQKLALQKGFVIEDQTWTQQTKSRVYQNLVQLLNQKKLRILDNPAQLQELLKLEKTLTTTKNVKIGAPQGGHDDMATVLAQAVFRASQWMLSETRDDKPNPHINPPVHERLRLAHEARMASRRESQEEWFD